MLTFLNIVSKATTGPVETKSHRELPAVQKDKNVPIIDDT